jgi:hypothetical protein
MSSTPMSLADACMAYGKDLGAKDLDICKIDETKPLGDDQKSAVKHFCRYGLSDTSMFPVYQAACLEPSGVYRGMIDECQKFTLDILYSAGANGSKTYQGQSVHEIAEMVCGRK